MPLYTAYITYTVCDEIQVEADNDDIAYEMVDSQLYHSPTFLPLQVDSNVTYDWDGYEISLDTDPDPVLN